MDEKYLRDLEDKCQVLCCEITQLKDERDKLKAQYEQALKDKTETVGYYERTVAYLNGKVAAYERMLNKRRKNI